MNDDDIVIPLMKLFSESETRLPVVIQVCNFYGSIQQHSKVSNCENICIIEDNSPIHNEGLYMLELFLAVSLHQLSQFP